MQIVFENSNGHAYYWFTKDCGMIIYRIIYKNGREPLATNSMDIIKEQLKEKKQLELWN